MKIAEMEQHHNEFARLESRIDLMLSNREFPEVFSVCGQSLSHVDGAIQFRKKREMEPLVPRIAAVRAICKYAPAMFEHAVMESVSDFVSARRMSRLLDGHADDYIGIASKALDSERLARMLWNYLEKHPGFLQRDTSTALGCSQDSAIAIIEIWEELGIIRRKPEKNSYTLYLNSPLCTEAEGMCPTCGASGRGRRYYFYKSIPCPKCGTDAYFHIVSTDSS